MELASAAASAYCMPSRLEGVHTTRSTYIPGMVHFIRYLGFFLLRSAPPFPHPPHDDDRHFFIHEATYCEKFTGNL
jgi:hypothetical protein